MPHVQATAIGMRQNLLEVLRADAFVVFAVRSTLERGTATDVLRHRNNLEEKR